MTKRRNWILLNINSGVTLTTRKLAEKFEVAKSTAQSDFDYFRNLGVIELQNGEWVKLQTPRITPTFFVTKEELNELKNIATCNNIIAGFIRRVDF